MTKMSDAEVPNLTLQEIANDGSDLTNPSADHRRLFLGEDGALHLMDSSGTVTDVGGGSGISSGTSNPGSPVDGDLFYRTDLDLLIRYRSTGTRWVTAQMFSSDLAMQSNLIPSSTVNTTMRGVTWGTTYDLMIEYLRTAVHVATTNNGSNYWTGTLADQAGGAIGGGVSWNTSADAADTWVYKTNTVNAALSAKLEVQLTLVKTAGAPGQIYCVPAMFYRLIIT